MAVKIFISHSNEDAVIAGSMVDLIKGCFDIDDDSIRCTSVAGHDLPLGASIIQELKKEINSDVVVLVLATVNSFRSEWVLAEMGAAWAVARNTIILYGNGLTRDDIRGPFQGTVMSSLASKSDISHLIDTLVDEIKTIKLKGIRQVDDSINRYMSNSITRGYEFNHDRIVFREDLFHERNGMTLPQILDRTTDDLLIFGWSCLNTRKAGDGDIWERFLDSGRKLRFLVQSPKSLESASGLQYEHICNKKDNRGVIADIVESVDKYYRKTEGITFKVTDHLLTWSGMLIDSGKKNSIIQIENYNYGEPYGLKHAHLNKRTNLIIHKLSPQRLIPFGQATPHVVFGDSEQGAIDLVDGVVHPRHVRGSDAGRESGAPQRFRHCVDQPRSER